jgi:hypothetical protein
VAAVMGVELTSVIGLEEECTAGPFASASLHWMTRVGLVLQVEFLGR